jgi:hypothetical protein
MGEAATDGIEQVDKNLVAFWYSSIDLIRSWTFTSSLWKFQSQLQRRNFQKKSWLPKSAVCVLRGASQCVLTSLGIRRNQF